VSENKAAIYADFADYKRIKSRKVFQLHIEVPLEREKDVLEILGFPSTLTGTPVAIARLHPQATAEQPTAPQGAATKMALTGGSLTASCHAEAQGQDKPRTYTRSQIAAMKCRDPAFARWLMDCHRMDWLLALELPGIDTDEDRADYCIKAALGIQSKSELDAPAPNPKADAWDRLEASFRHRDQVRT